MAYISALTACLAAALSYQCTADDKEGQWVPEGVTRSQLGIMFLLNSS